jgi:hypothetical protein
MDSNISSTPAVSGVPEVKAWYVLQTMLEPSLDLWQDEMSFASFADPAYRAVVLEIYRRDGAQARMLRKTETVEVLDE